MKQSLRIFPTLTILNNDLVKTVDYKNPRYLGDPINAIKLFNNKNVDEIAILDITSRFNKNCQKINYTLLQEMAQEAFLPLSYGGNINSVEIAGKIINLGFEKVILNSLLFENPSEVKKIVKKLGSQSIVLKIDYIIQNGQFQVSYNEGSNIKLCHGAKDKYSILNASENGFLNFTASSMYVYYGNLKGILINDPFFKL